MCWWFNLGGNSPHKWHLRRDKYWDKARARATQGSLRSDKGILRDFTKPKIASKQKTTVMEELTKEFNGKMQSLKFSQGKNEEVIGSKNTEAIARHGALLMSKLKLLTPSKNLLSSGNSQKVNQRRRSILGRKSLMDFLRKQTKGP